MTLQSEGISISILQKKKQRLSYGTRSKFHSYWQVIAGIQTQTASGSWLLPSKVLVNNKLQALRVTSVDSKNVRFKGEMDLRRFSVSQS